VELGLVPEPFRSAATDKIGPRSCAHL